MSSLTTAEMDRIMDEHLAFEAVGDTDAVLAAFDDDAEHEVIGVSPRPSRGKREIRAFYDTLFTSLKQDEVVPVRRQYGPDFLVDEAIWTGKAHGALFGAEDRQGRVSYRLLHILEFRDGRIVRERVWKDTEAIRRQLAACAATH
jgi:ketosteroid isomerase-like protein